MDDQKNEFDDFEDEFFDDGFDEIDDGFGDGNVNEGSADPDAFGDDWSYDESQADKKGSNKKTAKKSSNRLIIIAAVIIGFGVLVYQLMGDKLLGGNKFASSISEQPKDIDNTQSAMTDGEPVDIGALQESDPLGVEEFAARQAEIAAQQPPMPAPVIVEEVPLEETSSFIDDLEFSDYSTGNQTQSMTLLQTPTISEPIADEKIMSEENATEGSSPQENEVILKTVEELPKTVEDIRTTEMPKEPQSTIDQNIDTQTQPVIIESKAPEPLSVLQSLEPQLSVEGIASIKEEETVAKVIDDKITSQLETIIQRLEKIEGTVSDIDLSPAEEIAALKKTIASLEKDVARLQKAPAPKASNTSSSKQAAAPKVSSPQWELRAAQPGKAWVVKKGQKDIKSVSVGEKLDGIGTIRSIDFNDGRWLVKGSLGTIRQ